VRRSWLALGVALGGPVLSLAALGVARAQAPDASPHATLAPDAQIDISTNPEAEQPTAQGSGTAAFAEAPPPRPRRKGLVLEASVGVLGFAGKFAQVAPPAYWMQTQLGYEVTDWLMFFGEGEIAFTNTSEEQDESTAFQFPIWGFGAGARATIHATPRVAFFIQAQLDALTADVPHDALTILGFRNAESINASFGVRGGIEWYQIDRHLALCIEGGARDATGFAKVTAANDFPLMWDSALAIRYVF
jgi:hypothetical protein